MEVLRGAAPSTRKDSTMRGIGEIRSTNENPHHRSDEQFGVGRHDEGSDVNRSFESNLEAKNRREEVEALISKLARPGVPTLATRTEARKLRDTFSVVEDAFFSALLLEIMTAAKRSASSGRPKEPEHQERIHSAIDAQPPFLKFWQRLNDNLKENGYPEANYGAARAAFNGGATPIGSMTFIGKQWDGLRAVPAELVKYLGGHRPAYHGEYRVVTEGGTKWHKVVNSHDKPITYSIPEAALTAAEQAKKDHS